MILVVIVVHSVAANQKQVLNKGLSAAVYTQTTDVFTELNGLITFDRVPNADA